MAKRRSRHEQTFPEMSERNLRLQFKELQEQMSLLHTELDTERAQVRFLKRESSVESKKIREEEQTKANVMLKDLKMKMLSEKQRDIENLRDSLREKYDAEMQKHAKQKESELHKLRTDLKKLQDELQNRGLSGTARGTSFDVERGRLNQELSELRGIKKNLEESLDRAVAADRQRVYEMQRMEETHKTEITQLNHNAESEVRKLIDELKSRGRIITHMEKELGVQSGHYERAQMEKESMRDLLNQTREADSWEKRSPKASQALNSSFGEVSNTESVSKEDERRLNNKITDLNSQIKKTEERCCVLAQDKADLLRKIKEMEKKHKPSQEKNKRFLEKNMELTSINRNLEERIKHLTEENSKLKMKIDHNKKENLKLTQQLSTEKDDRRSYESVVEELEELQRQAEEQSKTTEALKQACLEKDRRIELIQHRRRRQRLNKQQQKAAGIKETYYGYDEDSRSVDSEVSVSSMSYASGDDDFWDEFTREEYEKNYQRLVREHLELEKSCALLQTQNGSSHVDPQRDVKLRTELEADLLNAQSRIEDLEKLTSSKGQDVSWMDEKQVLNNTNRMLREKVKELEVREQKLEHELQEAQEQNEVLEFRLLELEECNEKLAEEVKQTVTFQYPPSLTDEGMLQMLAEEIGLVEINVEELRERIYELRHDKDSHLSREEKIVLLQARAMLDIADKKLKDMISSNGVLKDRVSHLEQEKAELISSSTGMSADLVLEHEHTRNKLLDAELKIKHLEDDIGEFQKAEAVFRYTQDMGMKTEDRYRTEISELKKQLSSSYEGRDYESEIFQEKMEQLKIAEQRVAELSLTNKGLEDRLGHLEQQNADLQDQLNMQQDDQSLTESDKDMSSLLHGLRVRLSQYERSEGALMEKNQNLQQEVTNMKTKMAEYESIEAQFTERNMTLRESLAGSKKQNKTLTDELEKLKAEMKQSKFGATVSTEDAKDSVKSLTLGDLEVDNHQLRTEVFMLREELSVKESDIENLKIKLEKEMAVLKGENAALKKKLQGKVAELDEKEDDLNKSLDSNFDLEDKISQLEHDVEEYKARFNSGEVGEITPLKQKIDQISMSEVSLKERVVELEQSEVTLKNNLEIFSRRESDLKRQLSELCNTEQDLKERLSEKEAAEVTLEEKASQLDECLNEKLAIISDLAYERDSLIDMVKELEDNKDALESKLAEVTSKHEQLRQGMQRSLEEEVKNNQNLTQQVQELEKTKRELTDNVEQLEHDLSKTSDSPPPPPASDLSQVQEQLREIEQENHKWEDKYEMMMEEKMRQIETLHHQVEQMEDHELRLTETIVELEEAEKKLKGKIEEYEKSDFGPSKVKLMEEKIKKVEVSKQNLADKLEQMEMNEKLLRQQLQDHEQPDQKYLGQIKELQDKVNHLEARESKLMETIYQAQLTEQELLEQIDEFENNVKTMSTTEFDAEEFADYGKTPQELKEKIDALQEENTDLSTRSEQLEDEKESLSTEVEQLQRRCDDLTCEKQVLTMQLKNIEADVTNKTEFVESLTQQTSELETENKQLKDANNKLQVQTQEKEKTEERLKEKIDLLEESEGKLMDRVTELEEAAEKVCQQSSNDQQLRLQIQQLEENEEKLKQQQLQRTSSNDRNISDLQAKLDLLVDSEEKFLERIAEQEEVERKLKRKLEKAESELDYSDRKIEELERNEKSLKEKVNELEKKLTAASSRLSELTADRQAVRDFVVATHSSPSHAPAKVLPSSERTSHDIPENEPCRSTFEELEKLNKIELVSKVQELEVFQSIYRAKISELEYNLNALRQVMETVTYSISTDADIPVVTTRNQAKESEYERKVQELVRSEVALKLSVFTMEQKDAEMRAGYQDREKRAQEMTDELKTQIEELEDELDQARRSEARLKNKLEYGSHGQENQGLAKIQHLEGLVFDLETSEKKLKRKIQELEQREQELQERLEDAEKESERRPVLLDSLKDQQQRDELCKVLEQVKLLESSDHDLKDQIARLRQQPETSDLLRRLEQAERSEKALRLKLELLENEEGRSTLADNMLDTPEAILKQRIRELEKMEKHLKQQVAELERDREELHEIARKDKSVIHELNVQIRELQLLVQNLKEQLNRYEIKESSLQDRVDSLLDRIQELEDVIKDMQNAEKDLRDKMYQYKYAESSSSAKVTGLEHTVQDMQSTEARLKSRIKELEQEKKTLADKVDELTDRLGDTEGSEITLKQKLRNIEQNDVSFQSRIAELELSEQQSRKRAGELENRNEGLSERVRILEEEKSSLTYDVSELKTEKEEFVFEKDRLNNTIKNLKSQLDDLRNQYNKSKEQLHEQQLKEIEFQGRLRELERVDFHQRDKINRLENNEDSLKERIHLLGANVSTAENKASSARNLEDENGQLYTQLEHTHSRIDNLEQQTRKMQNKLLQYEQSHADRNLATIPRVELAELRAQVALLEETERNAARLEKEQVHLKDTVSKLRQGKDACGHELELEELKAKVDRYNAVIKANELQKENFNDAKLQMEKSQNGSRSSVITQKDRNTQVNQKVALHTTPEFKKALQSLKNTHPEAYVQITKSLPKTQTKSRSADYVTPAQAAVAMATPRRQPTLAMEDVIVPHENKFVSSAVQQGEPSTTTTVHVPNHRELINEFVSVLPSSDVDINGIKVVDENSDSDSSLDEAPVAGNKTNTKPTRPIDTANNIEKAKMIGNLVDILPSGELRPLVGKSSTQEETEWTQNVESRGKSADAYRSGEEQIWAGVESKQGQDDIAVSLQMQDDVAWSDIEDANDEVLDDNGVAPPPLPNTLPPPPALGTQNAIEGNFYLPDRASADEASDIDEDTALDWTTRSRRSHSKSPSRKVSLGRLSESMDSIPDSGMGTLCVSDMSSGINTPHGTHRRSQGLEQKLDAKVLLQKIALLEKQLKEKELEMVIASQKVSVNESSEDFIPKSKLKEQERKLELETIVNRDLNNKVKRLEEETATKTRKLEQLELELKNTARELRSKELANLPSRVSEPILSSSSPAVYQSVSMTTDYASKDPAVVRSLLERKDKELTAKNNEVDRLTKELRKWQQDLHSARDEKYGCERQLKSLQNKLDKLKDMETKYLQISESYEALQKKYEGLKEKHQYLENADVERAQLEKRATELRSQLGDVERLALERRDLEKKQHAMETQLRNKIKSETEVTKENVRLRHEIDRLLGDKGMSEQTIRDYHLIRSKYEEMERLQMKSQMSIAPLRAKVMRLAQKCQQKDELIKKLANELRRLSAGEPSDLIVEADREQAKSSTEEYNRPLSPLNNSTTEAYQEEMTESRAMLFNSHLSKIPRRIRNGSGSSGGSSEHSLDLTQSLSRDILNGLDTRSDSLLTHTVPRPSSARDVLSTDRQSLRRANGFKSTESLPQLSATPVTHLNNTRQLQRRPHQRSRSGESNNWDAHSVPTQSSPEVTTDTFRAVKDYNPEHFSYSGHPRLELTLKEGDQVKVLGPVDDKGYYEAQLNGQIGLVPATYLSPVYPSNSSLPTGRRHKHNVPSYWDTSPEQILGMHEQLQNAHTPNHQVPHNTTSQYSHRPHGTLQQNGSIIHPAYRRAPTVTTVNSVPSAAGIHQAFQSPAAASPRVTAGQSPSVTPRTVHSSVLSPASSCSSVPAFQSPASRYSSVHSLVSTHETPVKEGPPDPPNHFKIQRVLGRHSVVLSWGPPSMDAMARNNGSVVSGYKIYIDGREKQWVRSPHLTKALIEKLDMRRPHHFAIHTVTENNRSSKPAEVVYEHLPPETASEFGGSDRESAGDGDVSSVLSSSCYSDGERRVFMAVYDYSPAEHSPNNFPSHELAFKCGDIITTYGPLRPDGFYHGKIHGRKGLVPASFMEEVAISRTRSIKSLSTSTLNSHQASSLASSQVSGERSRKLPHSHHKHRQLTAQV